MEITTPAFLFSTISLLMGAYIARFSKLSNLIRSLFTTEKKSKFLDNQIIILKKRLYFVKYIQLFSVISLFLSALSVFLILLKNEYWSKVSFSMSIIFFILSLFVALVELYYSTLALKLNLEE